MEFALIAPVLFLVVFGIIDFGWAFAQHQDVRHGTREGARLAVVNYNPTSGSCSSGTQVENIKCLVKERTTSLKDADTTVEIALSNDDGDGDAEAGETFEVRVCYPASSLSGFFNVLLNGKDLRDTTEMRIEQDWATTATFDTLSC